MRRTCRRNADGDGFSRDAGASTPLGSAGKGWTQPRMESPRSTPSPARLLATIAVTIFATEVAVMLVLPTLPRMHRATAIDRRSWSVSSSRAVSPRFRPCSESDHGGRQTPAGSGGAAAAERVVAEQAAQLESAVEENRLLAAVEQLTKPSSWPISTAASVRTRLCTDHRLFREEVLGRNASLLGRAALRNLLPGDVGDHPGQPRVAGRNGEPAEGRPPLQEDMSIAPVSEADHHFIAIKQDNTRRKRAAGAASLGAAVPSPVREQPSPHVGVRHRDARLHGRERPGGPHLRLFAGGVPGDDRQGHPTAGRRATPYRAPGERRGRHCAVVRVAAPKEGRQSDRSGDHVARDRLQGQAGPAGAGLRHDGEAAGGAGAGSAEGRDRERRRRVASYLR